MRRLSTSCVRLFALAALAAAIACGSRDVQPQARRDVPPPAPPANQPGSPPATLARPRIVALGDSLTAGLGLLASQAYPALIQQRLNDAGMNYEVVNAGVSGDTSAGGVRRLEWELAGDVRILIVALGGNDLLRGLPPAELKRNLAQVIERAQARGVTVVLAGMEAPENFGHDYASAFHEVYPSLARQYHVALVPYLLKGVADDAALNQRDEMHPNARGTEIVADNVWAVLKPIVEGKGARD